MKGLSILVFVLFLGFTSQIWAFANELESEINSFQAELKPAKQFKKSKVFEKQRIAAEKAMKQEKVVDFVKPKPVTYKSTPSVEFDSVKYTQQTSLLLRTKNPRQSFIQKITALPTMAFSIFDGADSTAVSPKGDSSSFNYGISGLITADMNLFRDDTFLIEVGGAFLQMGSDTGIKQASLSSTQSSILSDQLYTQYLGIPLLAKWVPSGERQSSFYVKAGTIPLFLINTNYSNRNTPLLSQSRFGTISSFDVALALGAGYATQISNSLQLVFDVTGVQGLIPVSSSYSIYNASLTSGVGIGYLL